MPLAACLAAMIRAARLCLSKPLPNSRTNALWTLGLFIAVQVADGILTAVGVARFGLGVEANPLLVHSIETVGASTALVAAKSIAIVSGSVLHLYSYHLALVLLTVAYVFATLLPWAMLLG
jgi:hypothetical protein